MFFPHGQTVLRLRRRMVFDPYSGEATAGDWTDPLSEVVPNAFVASASGVVSSVAIVDATRSLVVTKKSLYCSPAADVKVGDRVRVGSTTWTVDAKPEADVNPFTGWQPVVEVPLEEADG